MSERLLEAFREEAELATPVPDFGSIARAGRTRRRRRYGTAALVAACVVGLAGVVSTDGGKGDATPADDRDPSSSATPWPGPVMTTLPKGTYEFPASVGPYSPAVRITLPRGWNAWEGPNRFEGLGREVTHDADVNERVLRAGPTWYADLVLLDVQWIAERSCTMSDVRDDDVTTMAAALAQTPGLDVVSVPTATVRAGRDAVHLRLRARQHVPECLQQFLFQATQGPVGLGDPGDTHDAWVIDADGDPLLVWASWSSRTPQAEVRALLDIVDSVELRDHE